jgi:hypothetical protein
MTFAHFRSVGNIPVSRVRFTMCVIGPTIISIVLVNNLVEIPSAPWLVFGLNVRVNVMISAESTGFKTWTGHYDLANSLRNLCSH